MRSRWPDTTRLLAGAVIAGVLAACGGDERLPAGSGGGEGVAVDFYLRGAFVSFNNVQCSPVVTGNFGEFALPRPDCGNITVRGGTDAATGLAMRGQLMAPAGSRVVSPVTTLIQALLEAGRNPGLAETTVRTALDLRQDPAVTDPFSDPDALAHGLALMQLAHQIATVFTSVPNLTQAGFAEVHLAVLRNVAEALPSDRPVVFDASFVTDVARDVAVDVAAGTLQADNVAIAIGPAAAEAARLAAMQITTIRPHFTALRGGSRSEFLELVSSRSNVDDNIRTITDSAVILLGELFRHDLTVASPAVVANEILARINLSSRVGVPTVIPR